MSSNAKLRSLMKRENTTKYFKPAKVVIHSSLYHELTLDSVSRNWKIIIHEVIHQTRETVFHWDIQTPRRQLKIRRAAEYF